MFVGRGRDRSDQPRWSPHSARGRSTWRPATSRSRCPRRWRCRSSAVRCPPPPMGAASRSSRWPTDARRSSCERPASRSRSGSKRLTMPSDPFFSPDGRVVGYFAGGQLKVVEPGRPARRDCAGHGRRRRDVAGCRHHRVRRRPRRRSGDGLAGRRSTRGVASSRRRCHPTSGSGGPMPFPTARACCSPCSRREAATSRSSTRARRVTACSSATRRSAAMRPPATSSSNADGQLAAAPFDLARRTAHGRASAGGQRRRLRAASSKARDTRSRDRARWCMSLALPPAHWQCNGARTWSRQRLGMRTFEQRVFVRPVSAVGETGAIMRCRHRRP